MDLVCLGPGAAEEDTGSPGDLVQVLRADWISLQLLKPETLSSFRKQH